MPKLTQMNKQIFKNNLQKTIDEIKQSKNINSLKDRFVIVPIEESGKILDSTDEMMKRMVLTEENIGGKQLGINDTVDVLGGVFPKAPLWINVSFLGIIDETAIFKLDTSLRFRKPTLLQNVETGHAPFKVIVE
ncbi:hypothetical protein BZD61_14345 [Listeria monocytogenes]|nr:hypothetical protein [Listeria monocytogenes]